MSTWSEPAEVATFLRWLPPAAVHSVRRGIAAGVVLALLELAAFMLLFPVISAITGGAAITLLGRALPSDWSGALAVVAMSLMMIRAVGALGMRWWWTGRAALVEQETAHRVLRAFAGAPYEFHLQRGPTELMTQVVAHVNLACSQGLGGIVGAGTDGSIVVALTIAMALVAPAATAALMAVLALISCGYLVWSRGRLRMLGDAYSRHVGEVYARTGMLLRGIREVRLYGATDRVVADVDAARTSMTQAQRRSAFASDVPRAVLEVTLYAAILVSLLVSLLAQRGQDTLAVIALFIVAGLRVMPAVSRCLGSVAQARVGIRVGAELRDRETYLAARAPHAVPGTPLPTRAALEFTSVTYSYPGSSETAVAEVSVLVPFGAFVGLEGASGAGKSTLISLLLGLLEPQHGRITYGGSDIADALEAWQQRIGYVAQDVFVSHHSLRENITFGCADPEGGDLARAIEDAGLTALVARLDRGLDTPLLEGGARLSAGERQRLGLARALYREPEVVVLDEPTASLDTATEEHIMRTISALHGRVTLVMSAHRLHTLSAADVRLRLDAGRATVTAVHAPASSS